jgi:hypothetical protein
MIINSKLQNGDFDMKGRIKNVACLQRIMVLSIEHISI